MLNPFTHRGSLYWFEINGIIRRNLAPSTRLRIYPPTIYQPQLVTICDYSRRRLKDILYDPEMEGHGVAETEIARVCNGSWVRGECPLEGKRGFVWEDRETGKLTQVGEIRGVRALVQILLQEGVVRPSEELTMLMGDDSNKCAPRERWYT